MLDAYVIQAIKEEEAKKRAAAEEGRRIRIEMPYDEELPPQEDVDPEESGPVKIPLRDDAED